MSLFYRSIIVYRSYHGREYYGGDGTMVPLTYGVQVSDSINPNGTTFRFANGAAAPGETFRFVRPRPLPFSLFSNTSIGCVVISPLDGWIGDGGIRSMNTTTLQEDLRKVYLEQAQTHIAKVTLGVSYDVCCDTPGSTIPTCGPLELAKSNRTGDRIVLPPFPINVVVASSAPGDYNPALKLDKQKQFNEMSLGRTTAIPHLERGPLQMSSQYVYSLSTILTFHNSLSHSHAHTPSRTLSHL